MTSGRVGGRSSRASTSRKRPATARKPTERQTRLRIRKIGLAYTLLNSWNVVRKSDAATVDDKLRRMLGDEWHVLLPRAAPVIFDLVNSRAIPTPPNDADDVKAKVEKASRYSRAVLERYSLRKRREAEQGYWPAVFQMAVRGLAWEPWVQATLINWQITEWVGVRDQRVMAREMLTLYFAMLHRRGRGNKERLDHPTDSWVDLDAKAVKAAVHALGKEARELIRAGVPDVDVLEGLITKFESRARMKIPGRVARVKAHLRSSEWMPSMRRQVEREDAARSATPPRRAAARRR